MRDGELMVNVGAAPVAGTLSGNAPAMQFNDVPDNSEAESKTAMRSRRGRIALPESVEHEREHIRRMPTPVSTMVNSTASSTVSRPTVIAPSALVNFNAFDNRFQNTCWSR